MDLEGKQKDDGLGDVKISFEKVIIEDVHIGISISATKDLPLVVFESLSHL